MGTSEGPTEPADERKETSEPSGLSRRETIASLLGIGGVGVIGASRRGAASSPRNSRPWKQDVDAGGHDLRNLGSLTMAANSKAITDFEGRNLSIGNSGKLNAADASPWEDTDDDGLLETPDSDGIDVGETETDQLTVGAGNGVTGIWGDAGELVPLAQYRLPTVHTAGIAYTTSDSETAVIPFGSFSFTNIEQIYVSLVGELSTPTQGVTVSARLYDRTTDTELTDSEITFDSTPDQRSALVDGPMAAYDPEETRAVQIQIRQDTSMFNGQIDSPTIHVWGEIA